MAVQSKHAELPCQDTILTEIVRRLTTAFQPESIYLFGSVARGEAGPHSDYDLLMVVRYLSLPRYRRDQEAFKTPIGAGASKDILVLTRKEFDSQRKVPSFLPPSQLLSSGKAFFSMQPETEAWFQKAAKIFRGLDMDLAAVPLLLENVLFYW